MTYSPTPHLLCGPHPLRPGRETLDALLASGVTCFIDLTELGELPDYRWIGDRLSIDQSTSEPVVSHQLPITSNQLPVTSNQSPITNHQNFPIPDYSTPAPSHMTVILDALDDALAAGHTVYLHCHGGRGRTGTVVGCWLVRQGMTGDQALARIAELRGDHESPETDEQRAFVLNWHELPKKDMQ